MVAEDSLGFDTGLNTVVEVFPVKCAYLFGTDVVGKFVVVVNFSVVFSSCFGLLSSVLTGVMDVVNDDTESTSASSVSVAFVVMAHGFTVVV